METAGRGILAGEEAPWIEGARRTLAEIRFLAHERTVEAELGRGRPDLAEAEARALVALDPLRESGYPLLMHALAAGGNAAQATRVFDECRRTLHRQAGTVRPLARDGAPRPRTQGRLMRPSRRPVSSRRAEIGRRASAQTKPSR